jgi:hypothetical protein
MKPRQLAICAQCGSDQILADVMASWNVMAQCFSTNVAVGVGALLDEGHFCANCDGPCQIAFRDLTQSEDREADAAYAALMSHLTPPVAPGSDDAPA